jgi:hypothetical protein
VVWDFRVVGLVNEPQYKKSRRAVVFCFFKPVFNTNSHIYIRLFFPAVRIISLPNTLQRPNNIAHIPQSDNMQFSFTAVLFGLVAASAAASVGSASGAIEARQAANGVCCIPNTSLKQDACTVNGAAGKCVPGGPAACKWNKKLFQSYLKSFAM